MRSGNFKEDYRQLLVLTDSVPVIVWSILLVLALALVPMLLSKYYVSLVLLLMITAIGVLGLNVLTGTTGLISLGHSGFLAVGAYAAGIVAGKLGWPMPLCILAGGTCAALAGLVVGVPSLAKYVLDKPCELIHTAFTPKADHGRSDPQPAPLPRRRQGA